MSNLAPQSQRATITAVIIASSAAAIFFGLWAASITRSVTQTVLVAALLTGIAFLCFLLLLAAIQILGRDRDAQQPTAAQSPKPSETPSENGRDIAFRFAKAAADATQHPVVVLDINGRVVISNGAARARFSLGSAQTTFANVVRRPDLINAISSVFATKIPVTLSMESRVPVDRFERASIAGFDVDGITYVMVSIFDDTEVRMSDRMRADFLANASHELRTPLAAIIGFIETLRGPARDDEAVREKFLAVMHNQADRMRRLISDLLSLSRIELNEHVAPKGLSDFLSAVHEAADLLPLHAKKRLEIDAPEGPIQVIGGRDEVAQIVINLIDNALKYSPSDSKVTIRLRGNLPREAASAFAMRQWHHGVRLSLTTPDLEAERLYGVLRIENTGDGIERQHLPRLSERFFRIEDAASGKSGTGLGLAIVKHIVSRHRGGLKVESIVGQGAAFGVYLPQPTVSPPVIEAPRISDEPATVTLAS